MQCEGDDQRTAYSVCDANGNVSEYLNASGTIQGHLEYSPFGKASVETGARPDDFAFRFSTKYEDALTGDLDYGFRDYDSKLGRWRSRDPIEENGGTNLYQYCFNSPINWIDYLGNSTGGKILKKILNPPPPVNWILDATPTGVGPILSYTIKYTQYKKIIKKLNEKFRDEESQFLNQKDSSCSQSESNQTRSFNVFSGTRIEFEEENIGKTIYRNKNIQWQDDMIQGVDIPNISVFYKDVYQPYVIKILRCVCEIGGIGEEAYWFWRERGYDQDTNEYYKKIEEQYWEYKPTSATYTFRDNTYTSKIIDNVLY